MKKMKIRGFTADTSLFCAGPASLFLRPVDGGFFSADNKKRANHKKGDFPQTSLTFTENQE